MRRESLTLAERTLEDFDARAFVERLSAAIPTFERAVVSVELPSRRGWGLSAMRTARFGKHEGLWPEMRVEAGDEPRFFYEMMVHNGLLRPRQSFAVMARAWYYVQAIGV